MTTIRTDELEPDGRDATGTAAAGSCLEAIPLRTRYTDREVRPSSNFVAHLIAIDGGYLQSRASGRVEPGQATAIYRQAAGIAADSGTRTRRCC
jgi:hypothetical protein